MIRENEQLRCRIKAVELMATTCLATQPDDDRACGEHLRATLKKIAKEVEEYGGQHEKGSEK